MIVFVGLVYFSIGFVVCIVCICVYVMCTCVNNSEKTHLRATISHMKNKDELMGVLLDIGREHISKQTTNEIKENIATFEKRKFGDGETKYKE